MSRHWIIIVGVILGLLLLFLALFLVRRYLLKKTQESQGCAGLKNLGSTCFLNSALQSLAPCQPFCDWLSTDRTRGPTATILYKILQDLNDARGGRVDPTKLLDAMRHKQFPSRNTQQDCHEMLQNLLELIEEEMNVESASRSYGAVHTLLPFTGQQTHKQICESCGYVYPPDPQDFYSITLNIIPGQGQVEELLRHYVREERIENVPCTKCDTTGVAKEAQQGSIYTKQTNLTKLPECLTIHINKTSRTNRISFREELRVSLGATSDHSPQGQKIYRLVSVVIHQGGLRSGHYVTYRRGPRPNENEWFRTSDEIVQHVPWFDVVQTLTLLKADARKMAGKWTPEWSKADARKMAGKWTPERSKADARKMAGKWTPQRSKADARKMAGK